MQEYLTVTALNKYIKFKFDCDVHLKKVFLKGEVSNYKPNKSGHMYLTLKDENSAISAVMFSKNASNIKCTVENGMKVLVTGYISVYEATGNYQIYLNDLVVDGVGNLHVAFEQLKEKLSKEGLFDPKHKQSIPKFPKAVGVITSGTGAAVQDIINTINRRYPICEVFVYPATVQGEYGKDSIISQIKQANKDKFVDVLICGRGGGSIEDLWNFNEEEVARAIFNSKIPIISAVGHETDTTISDFVSDLRAPTPTGAAELCVPNILDIKNKVSELNNRLSVSLTNTIKSKQSSINSVKESYIFTQPTRLFDPFVQKFDYISEKLDTNIKTYLNKVQSNISLNQEKLKLLSPVNLIKDKQQDLVKLNIELTKTFNYYMKSNSDILQLNIEKLKILNPLNLISKGYSVTKVGGNVLKSVKSIKEGDNITTTLGDGNIVAKVIKVNQKEG